MGLNFSFLERYSPVPNAMRLLIVGCCLSSPAAGVELLPNGEAMDLSESLPFGRFSTVGSASCSATACHGSVRLPNADGRFVGSEFQTWQQFDPHARAGWKLGNSLSQQILRDLAIARDGKVIDRDGLDNCLNCHAPETVNRVTTPDSQTSSISLSRGVGCESCHGAAEEWIAQHASTEWNSMNHAARGMFETKTPLVRARVCVDCHVGSPNRSVNHDLIAAGHPALRFEMSQYHNRLPKHWSENAQDNMQFQTQWWWAGQVATADAASLLLEHRAQTKDGTTIWPELAEFNCAGCHQKTKPLIDDVAPHNRLIWGTWNFAILPKVASLQADSSPHASKFDRTFRALSTEIERLNNSNRREVTKLANSMRTDLNAWIFHRSKYVGGIFGDGNREELIKILQREELNSSDEATQLLLAIVAIQRFRNNLSHDDRWREEVERVSDLLRFPLGRELPDWPVADGHQSSRHLQNALLRMLR